MLFNQRSEEERRKFFEQNAWKLDQALKASETASPKVELSASKTEEIPSEPELDFVEETNEPLLEISEEVELPVDDAIADDFAVEEDIAADDFAVEEDTAADDFAVEEEAVETEEEIDYVFEDDNTNGIDDDLELTADDLASDDLDEFADEEKKNDDDDLDFDF